MADNVTVENGATLSDYTVATDDDGSAQHQYTKMEWGGDGTFTKVSTGAAAVPIQDGGNSITVDGTVAATLSEPISVDDNDGSLTVDNPILSVVGGGTEAAAQRVTIASDSTGVLSVDDNGGSLTVDGTVAVSGTVTVDSELPAAAALTDNMANPTAPAVGAHLMGFDGVTWDRVEATAGAVNVDIARVAGTAISNVPIGDGVNGAEILASGADNTSNTANELITAGMGYVFDGAAWDRLRGDSTGGAFTQGPAAHDAAAAGNPLLLGAQMETMADSAPGTRSGTDADATKLATTDGALYVIPTGPQTWSYHENSSSALTDTSVHAAPGAGLSLYVTDIICSTGAATAFNIFFEEGASTVLGPYYLEAIAGRGVAIQFQTPKKITANTALTVTTSAAIAHSIDVQGFVGPG